MAQFFRYLFFRPLRKFSLFLVVIKHERCILARPRRNDRPVTVPVDLEKLLVGDRVWIEFYLNGFRVVAETAVGRITLLSPGVTHTGSNDAGQAPEPGVRSPESPEGEGGGSCPHGHVPVHGRNGIQRKRR